jgi:hypothetical protein
VSVVSSVGLYICMWASVTPQAVFLKWVMMILLVRRSLLQDSSKHMKVGRLWGTVSAWGVCPTTEAAVGDNIDAIHENTRRCDQLREPAFVMSANWLSARCATPTATSSVRIPR